MKKNNMFRIASVLLVAVLLSTCVISGAFAKYTTSDTASDTARVAAFGINVTATGNDAFGTMYAAKGENGDVVYTPAQDATEDAIAAATTVKSTADVVAPGTKGSLGSLVISGTAEVDVALEITVDLDLKTLVGGTKTDCWEVENNYYCPITIKVGSTDFNGMNYGSISEFEAAVEAAIKGDVEDTYEANEEINISSTYSWSWAFEAEGNADAVAAADKKDTALAQAEYAPSIALTVTATVTQID